MSLHSEGLVIFLKFKRPQGLVCQRLRESYVSDMICNTVRGILIFTNSRQTESITEKRTLMSHKIQEGGIYAEVDWDVHALLNSMIDLL